MANSYALTTIFVLTMFLMCSIAFGDYSNSPFIVAHKRVSNKKLNSDLERLSVSIDIYNSGSETAYDVTLSDDTWASEIFDSIIGNTSNSWERLDSGSLVSHSFELESKVKTVYYGAPALITYRVPTKSKLQEAYSTPILPLKILADPTAVKKIEIAKRLLGKYGSHISVVLLIVFFAHAILSPSKPNAGNKKRH